MDVAAEIRENPVIRLSLMGLELKLRHSWNSTNHLLRERCLQKNLNAPRPSEHPQSGGIMSKRLDGIINCKYKTSS